jgi:hypothetical protein
LDSTVKFIEEFSKTRDFNSFFTFVNEHPNSVEKILLLIKNKAVYPISEYGAWCLHHLSKKEKQRIQKHQNFCIDILLENKNQSVLRSLLGIQLEQGYTSYKEVELIDLLFEFLLDKKNKIAIHVYSLYVLFPYIKKYPELKNELEIILDTFKEDKSPAIKIALKRCFLYLR